MHKILTNEEQWLIEVPSQGIGEAVTKVEFCWVPAATTKPPVGLAGDLHLFGRYWFDRDRESFDQFIELATRFQVSRPVYNQGGFEQVRRGNPR